MLFYSGTPAGEFSFFPLDIQKWWTSSPSQKGFLEALSHRFSSLQKIREIPKNIPFPFTGGLCGAFAYDMVREWEKIPANAKSEENIPTAIFAEYEAGIVCKERTKECWYFTWAKDEEEFEGKREEVEKRLSLGEENSPPLAPTAQVEILSPPPSPPLSGGETVEWTPEISKLEYVQHVKNCQKELLMGNSFQINFSQKFTAQTDMDDWDIFMRLAEKNPAPMMFFFSSPPDRGGEGGCFSILSSSPERLFSLSRDGKMFTQPIAGTRKRGKTEEEDKALEEELKNSAKEMAEHSMLVDLLRNDFGQVAEFGSVHVKEFARVEKYASVMHLVSDVVGKLSPIKTVFDAFKAVFPGGTITGAPKIETMKILAKEELSSRSFYCGSAGYISFSGEADFNILIRTIEREGNTLSLRVGGGIVVEGNPEKEYEETLYKADGVMRALA